MPCCVLTAPYWPCCSGGLSVIFGVFGGVELSCVNGIAESRFMTMAHGVKIS